MDCICIINVLSFCIQGKYCPTTCGVADYMLRYMPGVDRELANMQDQLETITNLTQGAEETVVYMKDSAVSAQKTSQPGNIKSCPKTHLLHLSPCINIINSLFLNVFFE